ncbi:C39 family peptidase [Microtetraspora glauca]|uniref:C39 family peptidase n=1 Tax=Microtetraspora glauca TaxID=1996 RepID=A0ABV3GTI9_MICGL
MSSVVLHRWSFEGQESGVAVYLDPFGLSPGNPGGNGDIDGDGGRGWTYTRWTSPEREIGFPATELVPSWTANTPPGAWLEVELQARTMGGALTKWYCMGRWAEGDTDIHRTSLPGQGDQDGDVAVDTFVATRPIVAYRIRITLYGEGASIRSIGVMASAVPPGGPASAVSTTVTGTAGAGTAPAGRPLADESPDQVPALEPASAANTTMAAEATHATLTAAALLAAPATPAANAQDALDAQDAQLTRIARLAQDARSARAPRAEAAGVELNVPRRSQKVHAGHQPQWDGGGESWCSPASFTMVLGYWGRGPSPEDLEWVSPDDPCPGVDHAARDMYDHGYQGTGNWPFGVAYAGRYGLEGFVTRLRSLSELELFICAGIPVITSQSFKEHELPGSGYSTSGHIMVVTGITPAGDVIANDPAAPSDETVRRVYPREAFQNVWLRGSSSGGIVHVVHPPDVPLPLSEGNW